MIGIILFVIVVMLWDGLKKKVRKPVVREVKFRDSDLEKAKCGCLFEPASLQIFQACSAHELMLEIKGRK